MALLRPFWLLLTIVGTACSSSSAPRGSASNQLPDEGGLAPTVIARVPGDNLRVDGFTADGRYLIARDRTAIVYELDGAQVNATISIGMAFHDESITSVGALVAAADQALYRAKAAGRNCVSL